MEDKISRRDFLKMGRDASFAATGWVVFGDRLKNPEIIMPPRLDGTIGINNGHLLSPDSWQSGERVRVVLNRGGFDKGSSEDIFYSYGEQLKSFRKRGGKVTLVMEIKEGDSPEHLKEMFCTAWESLNLGKGDQVVMGNELNLLFEKKDENDQPQPLYDLGSYLTQAEFLYQIIKETNEEIQVGLAGQAYSGEGESLRVLLREFAIGRSFPFDFLPIHFYDRPEKIPSRVSLYREILREFNLQKLIQIGEMGVRVSDLPQKVRPTHRGEVIVSPKEQASAVWEYSVFAKAALSPEEFFFWFTAQDLPQEEGEFGLIQGDGRPRPAFSEMNRVQNLLNEATLSDFRENEGQVAFRFQTPRGLLGISWSFLGGGILGGPVKVNFLSP